ncbi:MAG: hypothetical protein ACRCXN_12915 [Bacteroidales bacterium]
MPNYREFIEFCAKQISVNDESFDFIIGDPFEVNNEGEGTTKPIVTLDLESTLSFSEGLGVVNQTVTIGFLYVSKLDDVSTERVNYFDKSIIAALQFLTAMKKVCIGSDGEPTMYSEEKPALFKFFLSVDLGKAFTARNKFSSNRDGLVFSNVTISYKRPNYCA